MSDLVEKDNIDAQSVAIVGVFGAVIAFVLIVGVQVLYYRMERTDEYKKVVEPGSIGLKEMVAEQETSLNGYKWVDRDKDVVTIPIDRAMELTVHDLQGRTP
jgi:hypothetical protein